MALSTRIKLKRYDEPDDDPAAVDGFDPSMPAQDDGYQAPGPEQPLIVDEAPEFGGPDSVEVDPWRSGLEAAHYERTHQALPQERYDYFTRRRAEELANGTPVTDDRWFEYARGFGAGGSDVAQYGKYAGQDFGTFEEKEARGGVLSPNLTPIRWGSGTASTPAAPTLPVEGIGRPGFETPQTTIQTPALTPPPPSALPVDGGREVISEPWEEFMPPSSRIPPPASQGVSAGVLTPEVNTAVRQQLLGLLNPKPITAESLAETPQASAFRLGSQRGAEREQAQLATDAEREGFTGTSEFDAKSRGISQRRGEGEAQYLGQVASEELQRQRSELLAGIQMAFAAGENEAARALQLQLGQMDDAIRRLSIDTSHQQFEEGLDLQSEIERGTLGLNRDKLSLDRDLGMGSLALNERQINEGAREFDLEHALRQLLGLGNLDLGKKTLGYDYAALGQQANSDLLRIILGGS